MTATSDVTMIPMMHDEQLFIVNHSISIVQSNDSQVLQKFANTVIIPFPALQSIVLVVYLIIFVVGSVGNGLTIYVVGRYAEIRMKSVANYYIWNLAFADFFFVCTLPFSVYATYTNDWPFGSVFCKLSYAVRETNKFVSVFTLVALSVDRFMASYYSLGYLRTVPLGRNVCATIWICFAALTTPYWLHCSVTNTGPQRSSCRLKWPSVEHDGNEFRTSPWPKAWNWFLFTVGFIAPFIIIFCAYVGLGMRIRRGLRGRVSRLVKTPSLTMTKTALAVAVLFLSTHLPYYVMEILNVSKSDSLHSAAIESRMTRWSQTTPLRDDPWTWGSVLPHVDEVRRSIIRNLSQEEMRVFVALTATSKLLVFVSSCFNPVIYGLLNHNYRQLYTDVACRWCRRIYPLEHVTVTIDRTFAVSATTSCTREQRPKRRLRTSTSATGNVTDVVELTTIINRRML